MVSIRKLRMNLLQSSTICGYLLPSRSYKCYSSWMRKSLHSRMMFLLEERSPRMLVILRSRQPLDCSLPYWMDRMRIQIYLRAQSSLMERAGGTTLSEGLFAALMSISLVFICYISMSQIFSRLVRCYNQKVSFFLAVSESSYFLRMSDSCLSRVTVLPFATFCSEFLLQSRLISSLSFLTIALYVLSSGELERREMSFLSSLIFISKSIISRQWMEQSYSRSFYFMSASILRLSCWMVWWYCEISMAWLALRMATCSLSLMLSRLGRRGMVSSNRFTSFSREEAFSHSREVWRSQGGKWVTGEGVLEVILKSEPYSCGLSSLEGKSQRSFMLYLCVFLYSERQQSSSLSSSKAAMGVLSVFDTFLSCDLLPFSFPVWKLLGNSLTAGTNPSSFLSSTDNSLILSQKDNRSCIMAGPPSLIQLTTTLAVSSSTRLAMTLVTGILLVSSLLKCWYLLEGLSLMQLKIWLSCDLQRARKSLGLREGENSSSGKLMRLISFLLGTPPWSDRILTRVMEPLDCPLIILSRKAMRLFSTTRQYFNLFSMSRSVSLFPVTESQMACQWNHTELHAQSPATFATSDKSWVTLPCSLGCANIKETLKPLSKCSFRDVS